MYRRALFHPWANFLNMHLMWVPRTPHSYQVESQSADNQGTNNNNNNNNKNMSVACMPACKQALRGTWWVGQGKGVEGRVGYGRKKTSLTKMRRWYKDKLIVLMPHIRELSTAQLAQKNQKVFCLSGVIPFQLHPLQHFPVIVRHQKPLMYEIPEASSIN